MAPFSGGGTASGDGATEGSAGRALRKKYPATRERASMRFRQVGGVAVNMEAHITSVEAQDGIGMSGAIVE